MKTKKALPHNEKPPPLIVNIVSIVPLPHLQSKQLFRNYISHESILSDVQMTLHNTPTVQDIAIVTDAPQAVFTETVALRDCQIVHQNTHQPAHDWRRKSRATIVQRHERLTFVTDLLRQCFSRSKIMSICEQKYGIKRAQTDRIIREANLMFGPEFQPVYLKTEAAIALDRLRTVYRKAMEAGHCSTAIKAIIAINRMLGLTYKNILAEEEREKSRICSRCRGHIEEAD